MPRRVRHVLGFVHLAGSSAKARIGALRKSLEGRDRPDERLRPPASRARLRHCKPNYGDSQIRSRANEPFEITESVQTKYCEIHGNSCDQPSGSVRIDQAYIDKNVPHRERTASEGRPQASWS